MFKELGKLVRNSKRIFVFTGAGISAPSRLPVFSGADGLWAKTAAKGSDPTSLVTKAALEQHPEALQGWVNDYRKMVAGTQPNAAHYALLKLQEYCKQTGKDLTLVTQNIDGFHAELAKKSPILGLSKKDVKQGSLGYGLTDGIMEIHGNLNYVRCMDDCSPLLYKAETLGTKGAGPALCPICGQPMRPHMLLLDEYYCEEYYRSTSAIDRGMNSDCMIVIGSGLRTQLPSSLVIEHVDEGKLTIEINTNKVIKFGDKNVHHIGESCEKSVPALVDEITAELPSSQQRCHSNAFSKVSRIRTNILHSCSCYSCNKSDRQQMEPEIPKGLEKPEGAYNCFINVIIRV